MTDIPQWLATMRAITGTTEYSNGSNPKIEAMAAYVGKVFPEQASYAALYTDDSIAWCGVCVAYCMATDDISGPFGPTDTDKWMWALAWSEDDANYIELSQGVPGAIVVKGREGGGHVTLFEEDAGDYVKCRGGNQSDAVNVQSYPKSDIIGYFWPRSVPPPPVPRRTVKMGDTGPDVAEVQRILGIPADGEFGPITDAGVKQYQGAYGIAKDGEVGPQTWAALDQLDAKMKGESDHRVSDQMALDIEDLCEKSPLNGYSWADRGEAPFGYYTGMCQAFAWMCQHPTDPSVMLMSAAVTDSEYDALNVYESELNDEDLDVDQDGIDTLRALMVLMVGLGMRESSGNHWEGRDMSASNVEADTCEAGLFQTSWNISSSSSGIPPLLDQFWRDPNGMRLAFDEGVSPTANNLNAYGSGDGARYQFLGKFSPLFHILVTGIGLRNRCNHWGPINRGEVDIVSHVDDLLLEVQRLALNEPEPGPDPEPEPGEEAQVTIDIQTEGNVVVTVTQNGASPIMRGENPSLGMEELEDAPSPAAPPPKKKRKPRAKRKPARKVQAKKTSPKKPAKKKKKRGQWWEK